MTQIAEKPSIEGVLAHYGKKGMHWGVRKEGSDSSKQTMSTKKKVAVGVGVGVLAVGAAAAAVVISKQGKVPVREAIVTIATQKAEKSPTYDQYTKVLASKGMNQKIMFDNAKNVYHLVSFD